MPRWRIAYVPKTTELSHELAPGFGHALLVPIVSSIFGALGVSASLFKSGLWWPIYSAPALSAFELEHGVERERERYNQRNIARAERTRKAVRATYGGYSDLFVPIVAAREVEALLVIGSFATERPRSEVILERWRALTRRQGHPADPEFFAYLSETLRTLVLDAKSLLKFEALMVELSQLFSGDGDAAAAANRAYALTTELEPLRMVERTWAAVRSMLDERSPRSWSSEHRAWTLSSLGLSELPDTVLVGLTLSGAAEIDPVGQAVRRDAFQRATVELARRAGNVVAGQVGDHGVVLLLGGAGGAARRKQRLVELADRVAALARRRFGFSLHLGASTASQASVVRQYQAALGAAESALGRGMRLVIAEATTSRPAHSLRNLREQLSAVVKEHSDLLPARFDGYLEAVALHSGYRVELARAHLEAGFERVVEPLLGSGAFDRRSFDVLLEVLDGAQAEARTMSELFAAYRRAIVDIVDAASRPVAARQERSLRAAVDYIHQHYAEALDFRSVARVAGFNPTYFSKLFHQRERMTFQAYVRALRIERAQQLLASTGFDVARIAALSGFRSAQHFSHAFRKAVGTTALEYRRRPQRQAIKNRNNRKSRVRSER